MQLIFNNLHLSRARSELVEEYPRALQDTLQQVQGERRLEPSIRRHRGLQNTKG